MDESTRLRMRRAHANHTHACMCGRTVRGNGGWASHRWACPVFQAYIERVVADEGYLPDSGFNVRRYPRWAWNAETKRWEGNTDAP